MVSILSIRLVDEFASFAPAGTFESFRADLGLTYREAATVLAAIGIGGVLGGGFSILADTRSRRVIASFGAFMYSAVMITFAVAHNYETMLVASVGLGVAATAMVDAIELAIIDLAGTQLEATLARINVAASAGDFVGPGMIAAIAAVGWSWRIAFILTAVVTGLYGIVIASTSLPSPLHNRTPQDNAEAIPRRSILAILRRRAVWQFGAAGAMLVALDESFFAFTLALFERERGYSTAAATLFATSIVVGGLLMSVALARDVHRVWTPESRMVTSASILVVSVFGLALLAHPVSAIFMGISLGAATIAFWIPFQAVVLAAFPGQAGTAKAIVGAIEMLGLLIPPCIGWISDRHGLTTGLVAYSAAPIMLLLLVPRNSPSVGAGTAPA